MEPNKMMKMMNDVVGRFVIFSLFWADVLNTLWLFNIAMGNGPFIVDLPFKNVIFYGYVSHNQMVTSNKK
jgi:hypothetical protein